MSIWFPILADRDPYVGSHCANTVGKLARVSKHTARALHAQGVEITIVAHKFMPYIGGAGVAMRMPSAKRLADNSFEGHEYTFDDIVTSYVYHNCTWETGYYPAFWVRFDNYHVRASRAGAGRYIGQIG